MMSMRRIVQRARERGVHGAQMMEEMKNNSQMQAPVSMEDFRATLKRVRSSVGDADMDKFDKWMQEYGAL